MAHFQRFLQNKTRLRHAAFRRIYQKDNTVHHFEYTLYLAAEIRVPRGIDDVDFHTFIMCRCIFGQNGDAAFPFQGVAVHNTLFYDLVFAVYTALFEHFVDQRGLAMVNVSNNRNIAQIFSNQAKVSFEISRLHPANCKMPLMVLYHKFTGANNGKFHKNTIPAEQTLKKFVLIFGKSILSAINSHTFCVFRCFGCF